MGDPFESKALFGMNNVGVCTFWNFLSIHNKLETVDLFFSPFPHFCKLPIPVATKIFFPVAHVRIFHFLHCLKKDVRQVSTCLSFLTRN